MRVSLQRRAFARSQQCLAWPPPHRPLREHAFGLARCFAGRPVTLLYLQEPTDAERHPIFRQHRREIERFARLVAGGFPAFCAQSYPDLWNAWQDAARPDWLRHHLANLRARYAIPLSRLDRATSDR
jgi:hypothetical protein